MSEGEMCAEKRAEKVGTIHKAYCFETDSIDGPFLALDKLHQSPRPHYFCPTANCGYSISGARLDRHENYDIAYFLSKKITPPATHSHVPACPFNRPKGGGAAGGGIRQPRPSNARPAPLFVPEVLVEPGGIPHQPWPGQDPPSHVLQALITKALVRPSFGLIEDVMNADREMSEVFRSYLADGGTGPAPIPGKPSSSLSISGIQTNYAEGIVDLRAALSHLDPPDPDFWREHVVRLRGTPKEDPDNSAVYYLNTRIEKFSVRIDMACLTGLPSKAYIGGLFKAACASKTDLYCYWWNVEPTIKARSGRPFLWLDDPKTAQRVSFVEARY
jgi:hypothetical protein